MTIVSVWMRRIRTACAYSRTVAFRRENFWRFRSVSLCLAFWLRSFWSSALACRFSVLAALLYPPLKYRAWGDAVIFVAYTVTPLLAMSWIVTGHYEWRALPALLPSGILTVAILHVNNLRDIPTDLRAGIRTFASVLGNARALWLYKAEILVPFFLVLAAACMGILPLSSLLAWVAFLPAMGALRVAERFRKDGYDALATSDEATAKLQLLFSVLLAAGTALSFGF